MTLELYYFESCPYCQIVLEAIDRIGVAVTYKDIHANPAFLQKLVADTGRRTVPCLYIDNKPMHESRDIIAWLEKNASGLSKKS
jgi:glutaredoxin